MAHLFVPLLRGGERPTHGLDGTLVMTPYINFFIFIRVRLFRRYEWAKTQRLQLAMLIAKRWKLTEESIRGTQEDLEPLDTTEFLEKDEEVIDDDAPRMFLTNRCDRVFMRAKSIKGETSSHPDVRSDFEWTIPNPPPGHDYALIVTPTAAQLKSGCVCPGLRHNKQNPVCSLNPRLLVSKPAKKGGQLALYTCGGNSVPSLRITGEQSGPRRRIRLVTYKTRDV